MELFLELQDVLQLLFIALRKMLVLSMQGRQLRLQVQHRLLLRGDKRLQRQDPMLPPLQLIDLHDQALSVSLRCLELLLEIGNEGLGVLELELQSQDILL